MTKFLSILFKIIFTVPVVIFLFFVTLENRGKSLALVWSPIQDAATLSLPVIIFAFLIIGFIWGSLILWSNTLEMRAERRALRKQILVLENQLALQKTEYDRALKTAIEPKADDRPIPRVALPEIL